jgi:hypothetical protein
VDVYRVERDHRQTLLGESLTREQATELAQLGLSPGARLWTSHAEHRDRLEHFTPAPCVVCGRPGYHRVPTGHTRGVHVCAAHYDHHQQLRMVRTRLTSDGRMLVDALQRGTYRRRFSAATSFEPAPGPRVPDVVIRHRDDVSTITVGLIEANVRYLSSTDVTSAIALQTLARAVVSADTLTSPEKQAACGLLAELTENLTRHETHRRSEAAIDHLAQGFARSIAHVPELVTLWKVVEPRVRGRAPRSDR